MDSLFFPNILFFLFTSCAELRNVQLDPKRHKRLFRNEFEKSMELLSDIVIELGPIFGSSLSSSSGKRLGKQIFPENSQQILLAGGVVDMNVTICVPFFSHIEHHVGRDHVYHLLFLFLPFIRKRKVFLSIETSPFFN